VFSDITTEICRNGAQAIFIITNDDWWYDTPGHRQHFAYARIKAIETRKWIARSANTGVSGIINPNGEIIQSSDYRAETIISGKVYLNSNQSFFTKNEKQIRVFILIGAIFIMITSFLRKKKTEASF
jgi:apolipoprotein N-acyltransferase